MAGWLDGWLVGWLVDWGFLDVGSLTWLSQMLVFLYTQGRTEQHVLQHTKKALNVSCTASSTGKNGTACSLGICIYTFQQVRSCALCIMLECPAVPVVLSTRLTWQLLLDTDLLQSSSYRFCTIF